MLKSHPGIISSGIIAAMAQGTYRNNQEIHPYIVKAMASLSSVGETGLITVKSLLLTMP